MVAICQTTRNSEKIIATIEKAVKEEADIVVFPELAITGYPPEDLLLKPRFIDSNIKALDRIREHSGGITAIVGFVDLQDDIFNAAAVLSDKHLMDIYHKQYLPNYGVFDENRYFQAGTTHHVYTMGDIHFGGRAYSRSHLVAPGNDDYLQSAADYEE